MNNYTISCSMQLKHAKPDTLLTEDQKLDYGKATTFGFTQLSLPTLEEVAQHMLWYASSMGIYDRGHRHKKHLIGVGNMIAFDIDTATIDRLNNIAEALQGYSYVLIPTQNYGRTSDIRVRLVLPIVGLTVHNYKTVWSSINAEFGLTADESCKDVTRLFAPTLVTGDLEAYNKEKASFLGMKDQVYYVQYGATLVAEHYNKTEQKEFKEALVSHADTPEVRCDTEVTITAVDDQSLNHLVGKTMLIGDLDRWLTPAINGVEPTSKVNVRCLHNADKHSDPNNPRYAWVVKQGDGLLRYYCGGNTCVTQFGDAGHRIALPPPLEALQDMYREHGEKLLAEVVHLICLRVDKLYPHPVSFMQYIDYNTLLWLILATQVDSRGNIYLRGLRYDGTLTGANRVRVQDGTLELYMYKYWRRFLFKPDMAKMIKDYNKKVLRSTEEGEKPQLLDQITLTDTILKVIASNSVAVIADEEIELALLAPRDTTMFSVSEQGKTVVNVRQAFDLRMIKDLTGVTKEAYDDIVQTYMKHWKDLPLLIAEFSLTMWLTPFNRPKALLVEAPSGAGKSALINVFRTLNLTNKKGIDLTELVKDTRSAVDYRDVVSRLCLMFDEISSHSFKGQGQALNALKAAFQGTHTDISPKHKGTVSLRTGAFILFGANATSLYDSLEPQMQSRIMLFDSSGINPFNETGLIEKYDTATVMKVVTHAIGTYIVNILKWAKLNPVEASKWADNNMQKYASKVVTPQQVAELEEIERADLADDVDHVADWIMKKLNMDQTTHTWKWREWTELRTILDAAGVNLCSRRKLKALFKEALDENIAVGDVIDTLSSKTRAVKYGLIPVPVTLYKVDGVVRRIPSTLIIRDRKHLVDAIDRATKLNMHKTLIGCLTQCLEMYDKAVK